MSKELKHDTKSPKNNETEIRFDLKSVCTSEEIERFKAAAKAANAPSLTAHFVNLTLKSSEAA